MRIPVSIACLFAIFFLASCTGVPSPARPVKAFDLSRYLGKWYEIARLDHPSEAGLERVTATYTLRSDGGMDIVNRGYDPRQNTWREIKGKAYFIDSPSVGRLKVSFAGPLYGSYNIIAIDKSYSYAMVAGPSHEYLWIFSRTPHISNNLYNKLITKAQALGFDTDSLVKVEQQE